jgi:hypothetical protein
VAFGLIGLGVALAAGLIGGAALVSNALVEIKRANQALEVKGFAERSLVSDFATWSGSFTTRAPRLADAYATLEAQRELVVSFLGSRGIAESAWELLPVSMSVLYRQNEKGHRTNEIEGYVLTQTVRVQSSDIDQIGRLSQEAAELVKSGIEFSSYRPEYLYTRLGELKIEMLAEATVDARRRAETLAEKSGGAIGPLLSARQGVFQITAAHSTEVSDYGRNDTSSRDKSIKAVVTVSFAVAR